VRIFALPVLVACSPAVVPAAESRYLIEPPVAPVTTAPALAPVPEPPQRVTLARRVCTGPADLPKEPSRTAACCYPAIHALVRPLRAAHAELRACYEARRAIRKDVVAFQFRIEQDGTIARVCAEPSSTLDDEDAVRCMTEVIARVRYPAQSDAEVALCGLTSITYPVHFEP
jgi:hypothetical protein